MFGNVVLFAAFLSIPPANGREDINSFIQSLKSRNARSDSTSEDISSSVTSSEDRASLVGQLRQMDLGQLVQIANHLKAMQTNEKSQKLRKPTTDRWNLYNNRAEKPIAGRYGANEQLIHQLLNQDHKPNKFTHKQLSPNSLLTPHQVHQGDGRGSTALSDYSKIYVIMDHKTLLRDWNFFPRFAKHFERSTSEGVKQERDKNQFLNGYSIFRSRRYRRDSKEKYGGGGSMEEEYRPKRPRSDHGGGGGGGRTAIPYIRHRGDIYERDN